MTTLTEAEVEAVLLDHLERLGYSCLNDAVSGPDGSAPERDAYSDTILARRLRAAIAQLNPQIPEDAREDALRKLLAVERPSLIEENRRLHRAMVEGVPVEYRAEDGSIRGDAVRLVDPEDRLNDWLAIAQFTVIENGHNRRPDYRSSRASRIVVDPDPRLDAGCRESRPQHEHDGPLRRTDLSPICSGRWRQYQRREQRFIG